MRQKIMVASAVLLAPVLSFLSGKAFASIEDDPRALISHVALLVEAGRYEDAIPVQEKLVEIAIRELGPEDPQTAVFLNNLAFFYAKLGEFRKAEPLYQQVLAIRRKVFGLEHPQTVLSLDNLAGLYDGTGEYNKAEAMYQQALEIRQKTLGPEHADTVGSLTRLGVLDFKAANYIKAEPLLQQALQLLQKTVGPEHPSTITALTNLAFLYLESGDFERAQPLFHEALQIVEKVQGPDHPDAAASLNNLALLYINLRNYASAEALLQRALQIERGSPRADQQPVTADTKLYLSRLYFEEGKYVEAASLATQALEITTKVLGPAHPRTTALLDNLAAIYTMLEDYAKAEPLLEEAIEIQRKTLGSRHRMTALSLYNLAAVYHRKGELAKAEALFQQVRQIWLDGFGAAHPFTLRNLGDLALIEIELGKPDEAKRLARLKARDDSALASKMLAFTSEQQRLAFFNEFDPYHLFAPLKGVEADLATAALRYKGLVLDSVIDDRRIAESSQASGNGKLIETLNVTKQQLGELLLRTPQQAPSEISDRIQQLEQAVDQKEGELATRVTGLGMPRRAAAVTVGQIETLIPIDGALVEYVRYAHDLSRARCASPRYFVGTGLVQGQIISWALARGTRRNLAKGRLEAVAGCRLGS